MSIQNLFQTACGSQYRSLVSHKTISFYLASDKIETIYYSIYQERYGLSEIVHEGFLKPSTQEFDIHLDYDFLLDHKEWSYSIMGIANDQILCKLEGTVQELLNLKNGSRITIGPSVHQKSS